MADREFYVGYQAQAPPTVARWVRGMVALLVLGALGVAALAATGQAPFPPKVFEWGQTRTLVGWCEPGPPARLRVRRPGQVAVADAWSVYPLVGVGKRGVLGLPAGMVELEGTLIHREGQTMVEVVAGSARALRTDAPDRPGIEDRGRHTLVGEIVDSKCFLGVMAPGSTKPHRACAARCLSGGIPPVLLVRDTGGRAVYLFLEGPDGRPLPPEAVLPHVAEPVEVTGVLLRDGPQWRFQTRSQQLRRLDP